MEAVAHEGVVRFEPIMLGRALPDPDAEPQALESDFEQLAGGIYTIRVAAEGLEPGCMKLNVVAEKAEKSKGSKKGAKGSKK
eukprot:scaffold140302_cov48-Prasinocladus_malaysianus.AAC.1